jgi:hypothetical protein
MPSSREASRSFGPRLERWFGLLPARWRRRIEATSAGKPTQAVPECSPCTPVAPPPSPARTVVLVTVLGLTGRALDEILKLVTMQAETKPIVPVFITDGFDFAPFRQRRLRFEYVPDRDRQQRFAPELDWDLYLRRRYALLGEKWQAKSIISFGRPPPREYGVSGHLAWGQTERPGGPTAPRAHDETGPS